MKTENGLKKKLDIKFTILAIFVFAMAFVFIYPFLLLIVTTFKEEKNIYDPFNIPDFTYIQNYIDVFTKSQIFKALMDTCIITVSTLSLIILFASMAGYMISRSRERIFKIAYLIVVCCLIVPSQLNMIVIYKIGITFHMMNTIPFLVLMYVASGAAFASMIYAAFTKTIPKEIEESARIDGCGTYSTFFKIILRLLMPATGTVIAITMFWYWNDFQGPLIYLNDGHTPTLMYEIFSFKTNVGSTGFFSTQWGPVFALCLLASIPMIFFFLLTQKYLFKGLVEGALKG